MKIIALEGGMGSGKSTIGKQLGSDGWVYFPEAIRFLSKQECDSIWGLAGTDQVMEILLEAERRRFLEIQKLPKDSKVVIDRSYYTFLAFEYASKNQERFKKYYEIFPSLENVIRPDLVIFIDLNHEERLKRLTGRGDKIKSSTSVMFTENFNSRLKSFFSLFYRDPKILLNLSSKTAEESLRDVQQAVKIHYKYLTTNSKTSQCCVLL